MNTRMYDQVHEGMDVLDRAGDTIGKAGETLGQAKLDEAYTFTWGAGKVWRGTRREFRAMQRVAHRYFRITDPDDPHDRCENRGGRACLCFVLLLCRQREVDGFLFVRRMRQRFIDREWQVADEWC